jgi:ribosome-binding protein aMBF1 (putative translation factor)
MIPNLFWDYPISGSTLAALMAKSSFSLKAEQLRDLLVEAREKRGLTQADVASCLGKPQSFVSKYERGERRLDVIEFLEVAEALEVSPVSILKQLEK